jgi:hypothetical protein
VWTGVTRDTTPSADKRFPCIEKVETRIAV